MLGLRVAVAASLSITFNVLVVFKRFVALHGFNVFAAGLRATLILAITTGPALLITMLILTSRVIVSTFFLASSALSVRVILLATHNGVI